MAKQNCVVFEALQLRWDTWEEMVEFAGVGPNPGQPRGCYVADGKQVDSPTNTIGLLIPTLEGVMLAVEGDWIIRGIKGEFYPCKPDIFEATYEPVETSEE
jgi:hypothetical protein